MIPRHPLIFKFCTICATCLLVVVFLHRQNSAIIVKRDYYLVSLNQELEQVYEEEHNDSSKEIFIQTLSNLELANTYPTTPMNTFLTTRFVRRIDGESIAYTIDQEPCSSDLYLMVYIHSGPENSEKRKVIRNTWASLEILKKHNAKLIFFMGLVKDANLQVALEYESELYHDIVQGNFSDTYRNLTHKAVAALKWTYKNCPKVVYVLKTDDDVIVDIHRVVRLMHSHMEQNWGKTNILAGHIWDHMNADRNTSSKWYTSPEEFPQKFYLKYCSGSAYILSSDVVEKFYLKSLDTPFFWIDDYYVTGMLAHACNVTPKSINDRYILENDADIRGRLANDTKTRLIFIHSPNTNTSMHVWKTYLDRW